MPEKDFSTHALACVLAALYLPGLGEAPLGHRRRWPEVERELRLSPSELPQALATLRKAGLWLEASALDGPGVLVQAEKAVLSGKVLTAASPSYPARWRPALGAGAPPALWIKGEMVPGPFLSIVGARRSSPGAATLARHAAVAAIEMGFSVCSGGAAGCDRAAAIGAIKACRRAGIPIRLLEILPFGLSHARSSAATCLSVCPPHQTFSSPSAMERNALIYAIADRSLVAEARFKEGGAWHGAVDCLRRRLSAVFVPRDGAQSSLALQGLGAHAIDRPEEILEQTSENSLCI